MFPIKPYYYKNREKDLDVEEIEYCQSGASDEETQEAMDDENDTDTEDAALETEFFNTSIEEFTLENELINNRIEEFTLENDLINNSTEYILPVSENDSKLSPDVEDMFYWTNSFHISENCYSQLINIMSKIDLSDVPSNLRRFKTLMTNDLFRDVEAMDVGKGCKLMYFGIVPNILLLKKTHTIPESIQLYVNIDGLPLFNSSIIGFWVILGKIPQICSRPFIIGLSCGNGKPELTEFLQPFIAEINRILESGISINENLTTILESKDIVVICDFPAKSFCKSVRGHTGYNSCNHCKIVGVSLTSANGRSRTRVFSETNCPRRSMDCFKEFNAHYFKHSPFLEIEGFNMVDQFPLDAMHCCFLGVMKRILIFYVKGIKSTKKAKFNFAKISQLSERIRLIATFFPCEFPRKPRGLESLEFWKAVEFKNFLLYVGVIALRDIIEDDAYEHFLMLSIGVRILNSNFVNIASYMDCAEKLLSTFVEYAHRFFGREFVTLNVHSLIHLVDNCRKYGKLLEFSAFSFENFLYKLKTSILSAKNPIVSVKNQMMTSSYTCHDKHVKPEQIIVGQRAFISGDMFEIMWIKLNNETISKSPSESYWILKENDMIIKVVKMVKNERMAASHIIVQAKVAEKTEDYFIKPIPSKDVGIYKVIFKNEIINIAIEEIKFKVFGVAVSDRESIVLEFCHHYN